ncbi:unnamed protein product [Clonostachys byssicola]|uniref:Protein kinase domain-containing protein n=1 Tax=Clonostachys byssicola TaxID=160290 RepID=A0A9N9Y1M2_9HYPO|nr:unnamed protein product [Clonostachys byssicola]
MSRSDRFFSATIDEDVSARPQFTSNLYEATPDEKEEIKQALVFLELLSRRGMDGIPECDLEELRVVDEETHGAEMLELGNGLTCRVVQHVTEPTLSHIIPSGTIVAVKVPLVKAESREQDDSGEDRPLVMKRAGPILQEIKMLRHPAIKNHPNIAKLCFVGWAKDSPLPMLAIQIGLHGTLDYLIKKGGPSLPMMQKKHITIDVASGLHAVHEAGFLYGDLKPANIIISTYSDPHRQVVAKLIDFGGAVDASESGGKPLYFTPLWCAPEVSLGRDRTEIDWERADVYSFGLIAASIWARTESLSEWCSSNLLLAMAPQEPGKDAVEPVQKLKREDKVLGCLMNLLQTSYKDSADYSDFIKAFQASLSASPSKRPSSRQLYSNMSSLRSAIAGNEEYLTNEDLRAPDNEDTALDYDLLPNLSRNRRRHEHQWVEGLTHRTTIKQQADIPAELRDEMTSDEFLEQLLSFIQQFVLAGWNIDSGSLVSQSAFAAAMEYFDLGRNREKGIELLRLSAVNGLKRAISIVCPMSIGSRLETEFPMRLFLCSLALAYSTWATQLLSIHWPSHFRMVRRILGERRIPYKEVINQFDSHDDHFLGLTIGSYLDRSPSQSLVAVPPSLHEAIFHGMVDEVKMILEGEIKTADFNDLISRLLHDLSYLTDEEAAGLARLAYLKGAKLTLMATALSPILDNGQKKIPINNNFDDLGSRVPQLLSPLSAAIRRGRTALALEIMSLHLEFDIPIADFASALTLSFLYLHSEVCQILLGLYDDNPDLCQGLPQDSGAAMAVDLSALLKDLILIDREILIERNFLHGKDYNSSYKNTLSCLLEMGANPLQGAADITGGNALFKAVVGDNAITLALFIEHFEDRGLSVLAAMRDRNSEGIYSEPSIAELCVLLESTECLRVLVEKHGDSPSFRNRGSGNWTLLHLACWTHRSTECARLLLRNGSNIMARNSSGHTPLALALQQHHLETADLIADTCTQDQLETLVSSDPYSGQSIFSDLVADWLRHRGPGHIKSLEWLRGHGGEHFYGAQGTPVWLAIYGLTRPLSLSDQMWDRALLSFLLESEIFASRVDTDFIRGRSLLHFMVGNGHIESVKLLRERNFDMAVSATPDGADDDLKMGFRFVPKVTALDFVEAGLSLIHSSESPYGSSHFPGSISQGGPIHREKWVQDLEGIQNLLLDAGCERTEMPEEMNLSHDEYQSLLETVQPFSDGEIPFAGVKGLGGTVRWPIPISKSQQSDPPKTTWALPRIKHVGTKEDMDTMRDDHRVWASVDGLPPGWRCIAAARVGPWANDCPATPLFEHIKTGLLSIKKPGTFAPFRPTASTGGIAVPDEEVDLYSATPRLGPTPGPGEPDEDAAPDSGCQVLPARAANSQKEVEDCHSTSAKDEQERNAVQNFAITESLKPSPDHGPSLACLPDLPDPKSGDSYGNTVIHVAVAANYIRGLEELLQLKEYVDIIDYKNDSGGTPLEFAVCHKYFESAALLLRHGAKPRGILGDSTPLLHYAICNGDEKMASVLIRGGADINEKDQNGSCPLLACFQSGQYKMFQAFADHHIDLNKEILDGVTIMDLAYGMGDENCLRQILRVGADPDARCTARGSKTLLHIAAEEGNIWAAEILLQHGADPNVEDREMLCPVVSAISQENDEMTELLLSSGADALRVLKYQFFKRKFDGEVLVVYDPSKDREKVLAVVLGMEENGKGEYDPWEEWEPTQIMVGVVDAE